MWTVIETTNMGESNGTNLRLLITILFFISLWKLQSINTPSGQLAWEAVEYIYSARTEHVKSELFQLEVESIFRCELTLRLTFILFYLFTFLKKVFMMIYCGEVFTYAFVMYNQFKILQSLEELI
jgi:hypothetical protein